MVCHVIKANPMPDFDRVFKPQLPHVATETHPFKFEERYKDKPSRETLVQQILQKEKMVLQLHGCCTREGRLFMCTFSFFLDPFPPSFSRSPPRSLFPSPLPLPFSPSLFPTSPYLSLPLPLPPSPPPPSLMHIASLPRRIKSTQCSYAILRNIQVYLYTNHTPAFVKCLSTCMLKCYIHPVLLSTDPCMHGYKLFTMHTIYLLGLTGPSYLSNTDVNHITA